jgi:hypothetical protein
MSDADLTSLCARLTLTLQEIEDRISKSGDAAGLLAGDQEFASLSDATIAADRLRYAAHFKILPIAGAAASL